MISTTTLSESLKWIKKSIGKQDSRKMLMCLEFKQTPDSLRIRSANGHVILSETIETKDAEELLFYLGLKEIIEIEKLLKVIKDPGLVFFTKRTGKLKISVDSVLKKYIFETDIGTTWNFDQLFQQAKLILDPGKINLDSKLLKTCLDGFDTPDISFTSDENPVIISEKTDLYDRTALIMPVKLKKESKK